MLTHISRLSTRNGDSNPSRCRRYRLDAGVCDDACDENVGDRPDAVVCDDRSVSATDEEPYGHDHAGLGVLLVDRSQGSPCVLCEDVAADLIGRIAHDAVGSGLGFGSLRKAKSDEQGDEAKEPRDAHVIFSEAIPKAPVAILDRDWIIRVVFQSRPPLSESPLGKP
jgi:hypothetical protein